MVQWLTHGAAKLHGIVQMKVPGFVLIAALAAAACAASQPAGIYSGYAALPKGEQQQVRVWLKPDGAAAVQAAYSDRAGEHFSEGRWQRLADGRIIVDLEKKDRIVFLLSGDQLSSVDWNRSSWGEKGLGVLYRVR